MVLLQGYGVAAAGSGQSGTGKIFPAHYKECRLGKIWDKQTEKLPNISVSLDFVNKPPFNKPPWKVQH